MRAKHTPGPWRWSGKWLSSQGEILLWYTTEDNGVHAKPEDARLIAAAPELLEALQRMEKRIAYYASMAESEAPNIEQWAYTDQSGDLSFARAAIAKATGEQP